ncbi:MAG: hypothetical protein U1D30_22330 [Planctomycetota bacterium]
MQKDDDIDPRATGDTQSREHEHPASGGEPAGIEPSSNPQWNEVLEQAIDDGWIAGLLSQQAAAPAVYPAVKPSLSSEMAEALWKTERTSEPPIVPSPTGDSLSGTEAFPRPTPSIDIPVESMPSTPPITVDGTEETPAAEFVRREFPEASAPVPDDAENVDPGVMADNLPANASPAVDSAVEGERTDNASMENLFAAFASAEETPVVKMNESKLSEEPASKESFTSAEMAPERNSESVSTTETRRANSNDESLATLIGPQGESTAIDPNTIEAVFDEEADKQPPPGFVDSIAEPELMDNASIENLFAELVVGEEVTKNTEDNYAATPGEMIEPAETDVLGLQDLDDDGEGTGFSSDSWDEIEERENDEPAAVDQRAVDVPSREDYERAMADVAVENDKPIPPSDDLDTLDELLESVRIGGMESSEEPKKITQGTPKAPPPAKLVTEMALTESGSLDPAMIERLLNEQTSDASGAVDPAIIEGLLQKTRQEPETSNESAMSSMAGVEQSLDSLLSEDSGSVDLKELSAPAPARPPSRVGEPKIDFAALRRAKSMDSARVKAAVGRIFGEKEDPESQSEVSISVPEAPVEAQDQGPELDGGGGRISLRLPAGFASLSSVVETVNGWFRRMDPTVLEIAGWMGLFLGVNGILILVLAILGWI